MASRRPVCDAQLSFPPLPPGFRVRMAESADSIVCSFQEAGVGNGTSYPIVAIRAKPSYFAISQACHCARDGGVGPKSLCTRRLGGPGHGCNHVPLRTNPANSHTHALPKIPAQGNLFRPVICGVLAMLLSIDNCNGTCVEKKRKETKGVGA